MRLSTGGFYGIDGSTLQIVSGVPVGPGAVNGWRNRQADLWAESSTLIHVNHRMTDEELGLWGAMQRELDRVRRALDGIEEVTGAVSANRTGPQ